MQCDTLEQKRDISGEKKKKKQNCRNLNKVCSVANNIVPMSVS